MVGLRKFPNATKIKLMASNADDAVRYMKPLEKLDTLSLHGCQMTGDGLEGLAGKQRLRGLELNRTGMNSGPLKNIVRGFQHLASCPSLEYITLEETSVDNAGLADIAKIKSLKTLYIGSDKITDDGLRHFAGHPNLETLGYFGKYRGRDHLGITEGCFVHLPKIPNLSGITVSCKITAKGLESLKQIPKLNCVSVNWPTMTRSELIELQKQLPNCRVDSSYVNDE